MPEQTEQFNLRKKIEVIELELKKISSEILELTLLNKLLHEDRKHNATEIDVLKSDMQTAKGAISLLKGGVMLLGGSIIAFCTWLVSSNFNANQERAVISNKLERTINDQSKLENKVEILENNHAKYQDNH